MPGRLRSALVLFAVGTLAFAGCSNDKNPPAGAGTPSTTPLRSVVAVTMQEYAIVPGTASAPAGSVTFQVKNAGPELDHEFVVMKTALAPDKLPTKADGTVDEEGAGLESVGEIGEFPVAQTKETTFTLAPGSYVMFCNLVTTKSGQSFLHYKLGMRTTFTVT